MKPTATDAFAGETEIDCSTGGVLFTVSVVDPTIELNVAVMVLGPDTSVVANPVVLMLATFRLEEVQVARQLRSCWVLSLKLPVAVNCCVAPTSRDALAGATVMLLRTAGLTVRVAELVTALKVAVTVI